MRKQYFSLIAILVLVVIGKLFISSTPDGGDSSYEQLFHHHYKVFALNLPDKIEFAGERVPMEMEDVREKLDRELHVNTYWQSNTLLLIKRSNRYMHIIKPILKKHGIPEDFKYLPVIESGFYAMVSPSGAEGPWQFMEPTAKIYGLVVNEDVDERYHMEKATEAACKYLKDAYKKFGNWTLAAASYNVGIYGLENSLKKQKVNSYYEAHLNSETARYIYRLLAAKEIMENPERYGFNYQRKHLYQPVAYKTLKVDSSIKNLTDFARSYRINYKALRELNPWIKGYKLDNREGKTYYIRIPKNIDPNEYTVEEDEPVYNVPIPKISGLDEKPLPEAKNTTVEAKEQLVRHEVQEGETLNSIAKRYQVKAAQVLEWNNLDEKQELRKGQVLKIYRVKLDDDSDGGRSNSKDSKQNPNRKRGD